MINPAQIEEFFQRFQQNSKQVLTEHPKKLDEQEKEIEGYGLFGKAEVDSGDYVTDKDLIRSKMRVIHEGAEITMGDYGPGMAPIQPNDLPENLVDNGAHLISTLEEMESSGLKSKKLAVSPWSDSYWPLYQGILGARYADGNFPSNQGGGATFKNNYEYTTSHPAAQIIATGNDSAIDRLSPSEKYDFLVGDPQFTLTKTMWAQAMQYQDANGNVETWMGICHGWSPASYCVQRPRKRVQVQVQFGAKTFKIRFYPSDIKGLASLLWADAAPACNYIGGRCNVTNPNLDPVGRTIMQDCFDTNPGSWHLSVVNQIGISNRSFVMDATYDYQVWNQPIYRYSYSYFNPQTGAASSSLQNAKVSKSEFTKDKFLAYRSAKAEYFVGIAMRLCYVAETNPSHNETDSESSDNLVSVDYFYDLELDANQMVIGGEWYRNAHPDFLWTPRLGDAAESAEDTGLPSSWDGTGPLPDEWKKAAIEASESGQPLAGIVGAIVARSQ